MNLASVYFLYAARHSDSPHFSGQQICNLIHAEYTPYNSSNKIHKIYIYYSIQIVLYSVGVEVRNVNNF
jgi:hypothetical protein